LKQTETKLRTINPATEARGAESGIVTVNNVVISDLRVPFGGIKNSGFGRVIEIWNVRICQHKISQILRSINSQSLCGIMQYDYMIDKL
jgi:hypothetical protein